jgi:hypothetical protein
LRFAIADGILGMCRETVEEEADESAVWMELIVDGLPSGQVEALGQEAMELTAIMADSRLTTSGRR